MIVSLFIALFAGDQWWTKLRYIPFTICLFLAPETSQYYNITSQNMRVYGIKETKLPLSRFWTTQYKNLSRALYLASYPRIKVKWYCQQLLISLKAGSNAVICDHISAHFPAYYLGKYLLYNIRIWHWQNHNIYRNIFDSLTNWLCLAFMSSYNPLFINKSNYVLTWYCIL